MPWLRQPTNTNFDTQGDAQGVFVGDVSAARGVRFRVLIVPGLIDGNFPRPARQDPLLLDAERQHLAETVGCEIRQRSQQNEEDRLLFSLIAHSGHRILGIDISESGSDKWTCSHAVMVSVACS